MRYSFVIKKLIDAYFSGEGNLELLLSRSLSKDRPTACKPEVSVYIFIGPESDHWECLSLTHSLPNSLTHSCLVNLIDVTLACEDFNSKLGEVVTVADVDTEDHVGNNL